MNTLQLTDRDRREAAWNCCFDCGEAYDKNHKAEDKGEQCVYCGKDSWTCEHFEASNRDAGGSLADYETDAERNQ